MDYIHYILIIIIITIIVIIQIRIFSNTKKKIIDFSWIFPQKNDDYTLRKEELTELINERFSKEIGELDLEREKEILRIEKEINFIKTANEDALKKRFQPDDFVEFLHEDGKFISYKIEMARNLIISRINKSLNDIQKKHELKIFQKNNDKIIELQKVNSEVGISISHNNATLKNIIGSINNYLKNNKTVSDYHLIKDIVDRNCDTKEEEIHTQIPIPLYMGLVGTMAGILIGILYLWLTGGIKDLLNAGTGNGANGVEALLGGVALAMISSILGIILTTIGSNKFKNVISVVDRDKDAFLSWIQAKLLPTLSDNVVGAIREMTGNFENFNKEFSKNTGSLGSSLEKVNESYHLQVKLLESIRQIADKDITQQNINLYNALKNSTHEIGTLAEYLQNCNQYLNNVKILNEKLGNYDERTKFIEKASNFYSKHENWLNENYDEANRKLQEVTQKYNDSINETFKVLKSDIESKRQDIGSFIDLQNSALKRSAGDIDKIIKSLSELGEVQKSVKAFESAIKSQNSKIEQLSQNILKLANTKSSVPQSSTNRKVPLTQIVLIGVIAFCCSILTLKSFLYTDVKAKNNESLNSSTNQQVSIVKDTVIAISDSTTISK